LFSGEFMDFFSAAIRSAYVCVLINYAIVLSDAKLGSSEAAHSAKIQLLSICTEALSLSAGPSIFFPEIPLFLAVFAEIEKCGR
jgi:hypothetical protein